MSEAVKLAHDAKVLSGEALAFLWSVEFCEKHKRMPKIQEVRAGVGEDYGEALTRPTAGRGLYKARRQVIRQTRFLSPC